MRDCFQRNRGTNNYVTRSRVLLLIHSTTEPRDRGRVVSLDNRNSIKLLASGFLRYKKGAVGSGNVSLRDLMQWKHIGCRNAISFQRTIVE
jgi:hypothetical protein